MPTKNDLRLFQSYSLEHKIAKTLLRIDEFVTKYTEEGVYISFSGGKDSTVLIDIVRKSYPNIEAVYFDSGLGFPETRSFVKTFNNVKFIKPKLRFDEVIKKIWISIYHKRSC